MLSKFIIDFHTRRGGGAGGLPFNFIYYFYPEIYDLPAKFNKEKSADSFY